MPTPQFLRECDALLIEAHKNIDSNDPKRIVSTRIMLHRVTETLRRVLDRRAADGRPAVEHTYSDILQRAQNLLDQPRPDATTLNHETLVEVVRALETALKYGTKETSTSANVPDAAEEALLNAAIGQLIAWRTHRVPKSVREAVKAAEQLDPLILGLPLMTSTEVQDAIRALLVHRLNPAGTENPDVLAGNLARALTRT